MALQAVVFPQDPFTYSLNDLYTMSSFGSYISEGCNYDCSDEGNKINSEALNKNSINLERDFEGYWDINYPDYPSILQSVKESENSSNSFMEDVYAGGGSFMGGVGTRTKMTSASMSAGRRKRRRTRSFKNKDEIENQRMTHIAVERNRRRQMNDYLAVLRSLMPPSHSQRGDQASIVGGAINFLKELEQLVQFLEAHKRLNQLAQPTNICCQPNFLFADFFTFPQYSTNPTRRRQQNNPMAPEKQSSVADIEVNVAESHANIKILARRHPKQLLKIVTGFHSICLTILHLNVTIVDSMALYCFSVKIEEDCQLTTVNEIADAVHVMITVIQEENLFN
uniref:Transcription factor bHLH60 n=1 Tax=Nothapodytes nimmoniana TaxID=159386 RepID=A0A9E8Z0H9_NOTNI|nr:transcription factor bHLH60 [Nothapodytes nimmoniana]